MDSILNSIKKMLGITEEDTSFDIDIIIHINTVFSILCQLGVGPKEGFSITDHKDKWFDYIEEPYKLELIKTYMYLQVRDYFDPPSTTTARESNKNTIKELEWRINVIVD